MTEDELLKFRDAMWKYLVAGLAVRSHTILEDILCHLNESTNEAMVQGRQRTVAVIEILVAEAEKLFLAAGNHPDVNRLLADELRDVSDTLKRLAQNIS